jgi:HlyD family secretion protein
MKNIYYILFAGLFGCTANDDLADAYGNFEAEEIMISSEMPGKLVVIKFSEGDRVKAGDVLAMVDTIRLNLQKGQLLASMEALKKNLQNIPAQLNVFSQQEQVLQKELDRVTRLKADGAATQKQYDDLSGELGIVKKRKLAIESQLSTGNRAILSQLKPLDWQLRQLNDAITRSTIKAPLEGTILVKYKYQHEITGVGQPLLKLADLRQMTLRAYVDASQLSSVMLGNTVRVLIDGQDGNLIEFRGTISWIADKAEFTPKTIQTRSERVNQVYAIKIKVPNEGQIKIGMPAEVKF